MLRPFRAVPLLIGLATVTCVAGAAHAQDADEEEFVVIKAGRVVTMAGPELQNVDILLADGKIRLVGKNLSYPRTAKVIDARREVIMPGMIHPRTRWQLPSYSRSGVRGDRSAGQEIYLSEIDCEPLLKAGFTAVCFYPEGTSVPGRGTIYRTAGRDDQRDLGPAYLRVTMSSPSRDKKVLRGAVQKARSEIEKVEKARKAWEEKQKKAQAEAAKKEKEGTEKKETEKKETEKKETPGGDKKEEVVPEKKKGQPGDKKEGEAGSEKKDPKAGEEKKPDVFTPPKIDATVLPFVEWIRDKKGPALLYELRSASDYLHLQDALKRASELPMSLVFLTSITRSDLHHVVKQLGEKKLLVLLAPGIGTLPETVNRYNLAGELAMAGCKIALLPRADTERGFLDHRLQLAALVRVGLPRDVALKSVTLRPAEALGIDKRFGSIEKGKDADLIFLDGDPLAPDTRVRRVMTFGEIVWEAR